MYLETLLDYLSEKRGELKKVHWVRSGYPVAKINTKNYRLCTYNYSDNRFRGEIYPQSYQVLSIHRRLVYGILIKAVYIA